MGCSPLNTGPRYPDTGGMPAPDNSNHESAQPIDTLRLTPAAARAINESLDRRDSAQTSGRNDASDPAGARAFSANLPPLVMEIHRPGTAPTRYVAYPRSFQAEDMSLLHGFFLNNGTACFVTLRTLDQEAVQLAAEVRSCLHVHGRVHEVVLSFKQRIDPAHFVPRPTGAEASGETPRVHAPPHRGSPDAGGGDELLQVAEKLVSLAGRGGSPAERRSIEDRLRTLLGKAA